MPRPNRPRSIGAEDAMRENVARLIDERGCSIAWVERKAGLPVRSLWKSLNAGRAIYVEEAIAIADTLDVALGDLVAPPQ